MNDNIKNLEGVDIVFFSGSDHYGGTDNHGLLQMFKFFKKNINKKSIFVNSLESIYSNNEDIFNISGISGNIPLAYCINRKIANPNHPEHPFHFFNTEYQYARALSNLIIQNLPPHKFIIIGDKYDLDQTILSFIMKHFSSKVIYVSMVNNLWTGHCSYPEEHECKRYGFGSPCDRSCPAVKKHESKDIVPFITSQSMNFFKNNKNSTFVNVGNSYVLQQAEESYMCWGLEKVVIPLKTVPLVKEEYKEVRKYRQNNRKAYLQEFGITDKNVKLLMWSSYSMDNKRKGFEYFIESLKKVKETISEQEMEKICIILSCIPDKQNMDSFKELGIKFIETGFLNREKYTEVLSACDAYCSTTISDAGPRTTYESAATGTPLISFDKRNSVDFVTEKNGALVRTYNTDEYAKAIMKIVNLNELEQEEYSENIYNSYKDLMDDEKLTDKWNKFLNKIMEKQ